MSSSRRITYWGHDIDSNRLDKSAEKEDAVSKAPHPDDVAEVRSFLGLINYYHRFMSSLPKAVHSLNKIFEKNHKWKCTKQCEKAFHKVKEMITSKQFLTHCDPNPPLRLACDVSPLGIGAVLSDGTELPIAFAPRPLTKTEKKYALYASKQRSIVNSLGGKKFQVYLFGCSFTLYKDKQPLTSIFHPRKSFPVALHLDFNVILCSWPAMITQLNTGTLTFTVMQMVFHVYHLKQKSEMKK